jgi:isopentenyl phosphate kinase
MSNMLNNLIFLKLGGSLITDKNTPGTAMPDRIHQLAGEIAQVWTENPGMRLVVGHGSGSFGHQAASRYGTRQGAATPEEWRGFAEVWRQASALNRLVVESLHHAGLPAIVFPVSGSALADDGEIIEWLLTPLKNALEYRLLPVVFGDVAFDRSRGGTILSTEEIFAYLAHQLRPQRILLAGIEPGVWADYPACTRLIDEITPHNFTPSQSLQGAAATDVTGGMASKVRNMLNLSTAIPGLQIQIFSALIGGDLLTAFRQPATGTLLHDPGDLAGSRENRVE